MRTKLDILNDKVDTVFNTLALYIQSTSIPDGCRFMFNQYHDRYMHLLLEQAEMIEDCSQ